MNNSQDQKFNTIENLQWLPGVGDTYFNDDVKKLLIVGESHYLPDETKDWHDDVPEKIFTRGFLEDNVVNKPNADTPILRNLERALFNKSSVSVEEKHKLWFSASYYNFIQRPLDSIKNDHRPIGNDYKIGWQTFFKVIDILQPKYCLFSGVSAADYFGYFKEFAESNEYELMFDYIQQDEKIGNTKPRRIIIKKDQNVLPIIFIKHSSSFFSYESWAEYIQSNMPEYIKWLRQ